MVKRIFPLVLAFVLFHGTGRAAPEGFEVTDYLTGLEVCITLAFAPDGRLFFLEKNSGRVSVVREGRLDPKPWAELKVDPEWERGLLGIAFDPKFSVNGHVYLYHSVPGSSNNRVVRLTEKDGRGAGAIKVLEIEDHVPASNHNGGNINFGPDGFLYITVGDGGGAPGRSQENTNLLGKMLRVDVRGPLPVRYKKPTELFYAKGLRNSFDMAWNPANAALYATENGPIGRDEINIIREGGNYGWPDETGYYSTHEYENPLWDFGLRAVAPTGIVFYPEGGEGGKGGNFPDDYTHNMFVTDYNYGRVYRIRLSGEGLDTIRKDDFSVWMEKGFAGTTFADITVGPDGALYLAGFHKIVKIEYRPGAVE
ncbi:MAG: PQQ-dependent sugar dehydrogenase [Thermodesulfobacteriota bacterium]